MSLCTTVIDVRAVKEHTIGVSVVQRKRKRDGETETLLVKRPATVSEALLAFLQPMRS